MWVYEQVQFDESKFVEWFVNLDFKDSVDLPDGPFPWYHDFFLYTKLYLFYYFNTIMWVIVIISLICLIGFEIKDYLDRSKDDLGENENFKNTKIDWTELNGNDGVE